MKLRKRILSGSIHLKISMLFTIIFAMSCSSDIESKMSDKIHYGINLEILREYKGFLQIPGVGWQLWKIDCPHIENYNFKPGSHYDRYAWAQIEPSEGVYNFELLDRRLKDCRERNLAYAFRIATCRPGWGGGPVAIPDWLVKKGAKLLHGSYQGDEFYAADMDCPIIRQYHEKLIKALGERYDGHPDLALLDIGSVGMWGEWHFTGNQHLLPSLEARKAVIDLYYEAFPNTPLTISSNARISGLLTYAIEKGSCGWRGDSWGDGSREPWNHHEGQYWPSHNQNPDGWKTGTVAMEPGWVLGDYSTPPKDVVDDAIAWHATLIKNKNTLLPAEWMPDIERLMMIIGFRLVLRNLTFNEHILSAGDELTLHMEWENIGIAPPYRDYRIAFRMRDENNKLLTPSITNHSIKGWLPGEENVVVKHRIPGDLEPGGYTIEMGLVFHSSIGHNIPIANHGKTRDGWYNLGTIWIL